MLVPAVVDDTVKFPYIIHKEFLWWEYLDGNGGLDNEG